MTIPPIINVIVSESSGLTTTVTEISENHVGIVLETGSYIQTNVHSAPSAYSQYAYAADTASYSHTASYAQFAASSIGTIQSSSYATYAVTSDSSSWASQSLTASYAEVFPYVGDAVVTGSVETTDSVTANKLVLNSGDGLFVITSSVSEGIFGVTETVYPIIPTASFSGAMIEYMAQRSSGARMGIVMALWNSASYKFTDVSTSDIGDTSDLIAGFLMLGENIIFQVHSLGSGSGAWNVQATFKLFPKTV